MLRSKPMEPRGRPLIAFGYKYKARKVIYFIVRDNAGCIHAGISYLYKYFGQFYNVSVFPVGFPFVCLSSLDLLMILTPTINQGSLIWCWRSSGSLSVVVYDYVRQLLWE